MEFGTYFDIAPHRFGYLSDNTASVSHPRPSQDIFRILDTIAFTFTSAELFVLKGYLDSARHYAGVGRVLEVSCDTCFECFAFLNNFFKVASRLLLFSCDDLQLGDVTSYVH